MAKTRQLNTFRQSVLNTSEQKNNAFSFNNFGNKKQLNRSFQ